MNRLATLTLSWALVGCAEKAAPSEGAPPAVSVQSASGSSGSPGISASTSIIG